ncbi:metal tolerance protein 3 [Acrodontium crateriforme]|uniref:Metal tolerance protein 3 n=1 Tax=Acrodontium crateriforme TaxID=150365 RepID=A0AAQ3LWM1_9PEZI|nr:metal tolerance protein 3 [Acrodontium crateriforme]
MSDTRSESPAAGRMQCSSTQPRLFNTSGEETAAALTTRGHTFLTLVQTRSHSVRRRATGRRRSSLDENEFQTQRGFDSDHEVAAEPLHKSQSTSGWGFGDYSEERRSSMAASILHTPQMRSQRLIGNSNPRYRWEKYFKNEDELKAMSKPLRQYYERNNFLIQHYRYIDKLLDSSLPHDLLQEYQGPKATQNLDLSDVPTTICEEDSPTDSPQNSEPREFSESSNTSNSTQLKVKRTPKDIYRVKERSQDDESTPLLRTIASEDDEEAQLGMPPDLEIEEEAGSQSRIVSIAIYINMIANTILLILKIVVVALSSSVSVLASLVDAALDFLSTAIVWITTRLIAHNDQYAYPIGRRRLEPVGVLVFSVIMITSFVQVAIQGFSKLTSDDREIVELTPAAIGIMTGTVVIKGGCWLWCRLIKNSSVQALAQDAMTDVVFNIFSIIFPLIGFYARIWWLDPLGGILLSFWVILNWAQTSTTHIRNLTGCTATADERNVLLYLTMRFAKTIKQIQGLQAYHSGDKLNVEVDIVLDEGTSLRDSHDLGESLQYVLESVPNVDRAFVHLDYASYNLPSHLQQDS